MPKHRIVYVSQGTPCHWQVQTRVFLFFWKNEGFPASSATTAANEILKLMGKRYV
ncbi:hypothetical protein KAR91_50970 [Candidatus Pacearchaeota archaeon]|nr:hypothetical protein [Candidatus Pacearchaeota archaeon]